MDKLPPDENWYRRKVGRRVERAANRLVALVLAAIGVVAGLFSIPGEDDGPRWIGLGSAVLFLWLARMAWNAKRSVIDP